MDEKTKLLVSLRAPVAANCVPCFEHFLVKTKAAGLTLEEIREATEIADPLSYPWLTYDSSSAWCKIHIFLVDKTMPIR